MDKSIIWAAGFIDGEGTITIKRVRRSRSTMGKKCDGQVHYYQAYISCAQSDKPLARKAILKLQTLFGGSIMGYKQTGQRWDTVQWTVVSNDALKCVKSLLPFLVVKCPQARILIDFCSRIKRTGFLKGGHSNYRLSDEEINLRQKMFYKMREYNAKGRLHLQRLNEVAPKGDAIVRPNGK